MTNKSEITVTPRRVLNGTIKLILMSAFYIAGPGLKASWLYSQSTLKRRGSANWKPRQRRSALKSTISQNEFQKTQTIWPQ